MKPSLKKVLDVIDKYLATGDKEDSRDLWDVLAALRGPDLSENCYLVKDATTSVIRAKAFPRTAKLSNREGGRVCASMAKDSMTNIATRYNQPSSHFIGHARSAFSALGLHWAKNNNEDLTKEKQ